VNVTINGDVNMEPDETFFVDLSAPINGVIGDAQGMGTITNDDMTGPPPTVVTGAASSINTANARLNGTANPNGAATTANFQYGTTIAYGSTTPVQSIGSGVAPVAIANGAATALACNTLYHFRATATNINGTAFGSDATFTTGPCGTIPGSSSTSQGVVYALTQVNGGAN